MGFLKWLHLGRSDAIADEATADNVVWDPRHPAYAVLVTGKGHNITGDGEAKLRFLYDLSPATKIMKYEGPLVSDAATFQAMLARAEVDYHVKLLGSPTVMLNGKVIETAYSIALVYDSLGHEADALVTELVNIARKPGFLTLGANDDAFNEHRRNRRAIQIGQRLFELGGIALMKAVHSRVRCQIHHLRGAARELEVAWGGIGSWLG